MERLRPVYETGVLRLLLRQNSMMYVALLRAAFDPLTGELPRETLEESFSQSLSRLVDSGEYQLREDQTIADASRRILADLTREGDDDYAWLANSHDAASHRFLYRLTARAHRAIEALSRLEDDSRTLSGAQANSIIMRACSLPPTPASAWRCSTGRSRRANTRYVRYATVSGRRRSPNRRSRT